METNFAISEFIGDPSFEPIPCIFKQRYTDFIVQEISTDKTIVSPIDIVVKNENKKDDAQLAFLTDEHFKNLESLKEGEKYKIEVPSNISKDARKETHRLFGTKFPGRYFLKFADGFLEINVYVPKNKRLPTEQSTDDAPSTKKIKEDNSEKVLVNRPEILSMDDVLQIIKIEEDLASTETLTIDAKCQSKENRKQIHEYVTTNFKGLDVKTESGIMTIKRRSKDSKPDRRNRNWPKDRPDYLHFTLAKENKDTHYAIGMISKFSGLTPKIFGIAGTKDRRAITYQKVSAYHVEPTKLSTLNNNLYGICLGNFSFEKEPLTLGDLYGNRFSIVLRNVKNLTEEMLIQRLNQWKEKGFINYYGTQRFGTFEISTAEVGHHILSQDWEQAVKLILKPKTGSPNSPLQRILKRFAETNDADSVIKEFPFISQMSAIEALILRKLQKQKNAYKMAILSLPRNMRSLYVHAYQSLLFNRIASMRIKKHGLNLLAGDVDEMGKLLCPGDDIYQVALPLPTSNTNLLENEVSEWYQQILTENGITLESFAKLGKDFAIGDEVYRKFIIRPEDVEHQLLEYQNSDQDLQPSPFSNTSLALSSDESCKSAFLAIKLKFSLCSGSYATIALRELLRYDLSPAHQKTISHEELENMSEDS